MCEPLVQPEQLQLCLLLPDSEHSPLVPCLLQAGIGTRFLRGHRQMSTPDKAIFTAYILLVLAHMLWRWCYRRSYYRWRHLSGTAFALAATCAPRFWQRRVLGLSKAALAPAGINAAQTALVTARAVLVSSYTLQLFVYGLTRTAPLWIKLPTHALSVGVGVSYAGAMCATPVFSQPAVTGWLGTVYRAFRSLTALLPLSVSPMLPEPSQQGTCQAVLSFVHVLLGFCFPMMVAAAVEMRARQQHALIYRQFWPRWRQLKRQPWWRFVEWLCFRPRLFHSRTADVAVVLAAVATLWEVVVALLASAAHQ